MIDKVKAIQSLKPNAEWVLRGDELEWLDSNTTKPTESEIQAEITRLQAEYDAKEYQRKRSREYPSWEKQLEKIYDDGIDAWKSEMIDIWKRKWNWCSYNCCP
jgi:hypothetical protein